MVFTHMPFGHTFALLQRSLALVESNLVQTLMPSHWRCSKNLPLGDVPITKFDDFRTGLLDPDSGSARDINFAGLTLPDVLIVVRRVLAFTNDGSACNGDGVELSLDTQIVYNATLATAHTQLCLSSDSTPFRHFQPFSCIHDDAPFVELTFLPDDIVDRADPLTSVVRFVNGLCVGTSVSDYFVRYENASWDLGDTGPTSGVIFTKADVATIT